MQFIPSTWATYGNGGDVNDDHDAILAAGRFLAGERRRQQTSTRALYAYNPSDDYVAAVQDYAGVIASRPTRLRRLLRVAGLRDDHLRHAATSPKAGAGRDRGMSSSAGPTRRGWPQARAPARPSTAVISMRNVTPTTVASKNLVTSSQVAAAVPPVARTSSTISTRSSACRRVAVHLEHVVAVLELVAVGVRVPGQLALFAHGHEAGPEHVRDRRGEDESRVPPRRPPW